MKKKNMKSCFKDFEIHNAINNQYEFISKLPICSFLHLNGKKLNISEYHYNASKNAFILKHPTKKGDVLRVIEPSLGEFPISNVYGIDVIIPQFPLMVTDFLED